MDLSLMATPEVIAKTGITRNQIKRMQREGLFPQPVDLPGSRIRYFYQSEINYFMTQLGRGLPPEVIRANLTDLRQRTTASQSAQLDVNG